MNKQRKVLITFLSVILVNCLYAGFLDGLKKVGEGVADVAGGVVDNTVNATTSVVQSVKQQTVFADPQTNVATTVQTVPAVTPAPAPSVATTLMPKATTIENSVAKNGSTTIIQDNTSYTKDRADLEKRLQSFRFREDYQSIESVSEKNRIANRVNVAKSNLMSLPHKAEGNASRQLRKILDEEAEIVATVKEVLNKESEERIAREKTAAAPVPTAVPSRASMATPASVTASAPQVTERKSPSAEDGDNSFEQQYKLATDYLNSEEFIKQLDDLVKLDVGGKRYGEDARSGAYIRIAVRDQGLTREISTEKIPGLPKFCEKWSVMRMPEEGKFNQWKDVLQSNIERERQYMAEKAVENTVRKVIEGELKLRCAEYNKAGNFAGKIYSSIRSELQPQHPYMACMKEEWNTTNFGHGHDDGSDGIYRLYDLDGWKNDSIEGRRIFTSGCQSKLTKEIADMWIAHVRKWLARNDVLLSRLTGVGIKEKCGAFYAKAEGTNTVPFKVYRDIAFGSVIGDVYGEMERHAQNSGANHLEWRGETLDMFLNGCSFNVSVKPHDIQFIFGAFAPDEVPVLTAMKMKFTQAAPSVDALVEKYGKMDGAKIERKSEVVKRVWPETEVGQFWRMVAMALEAKVKQSGSKGIGDTFKKDVESIFASHSKAITRERVRIDMGGVTVDISEDSSTHFVSSIFFKDTLLSAKLMELCRNQKAAAKKAEAEAKAAAEKKAKSDSLNF